MKPIRLASFGLRAYAGDTLTPRVLIDFASAFATYTDGGRILIGRDTRYSSPMIHSAVVSGLLSAGCEVLDLGVCPTPMLQFSVTRYDAAGAISISGGHNGAGWNALTLIGPDGAFLEPIGGEAVLDIFHAADFLKRDWRGMGHVQLVSDFVDPYFEALTAQVNVEAIGRSHLIGLIDPVGGAGCAFLDQFARHLGFAHMAINGEPSGYLARDPEPRPRTAKQMASVIPHMKGDVGFVLSSDMGRLSLVTEDGEPASEEYTFPVIANHVLSKRSGTLVTNCCTTRMLDDIAGAHGARVVKTRVGQAFVVSAVADENAVIGGEGSGSVAVADFSPAFDGFLMMALVLEAMAETQTRLSDLLRALPRYHIVKREIHCESRAGYRGIEQIEKTWRDEGPGTIDATDGLRVDWDDGWVHVRTSRTEQMVRIISEAASAGRAIERADEITRIMEQAI